LAYVLNLREDRQLAKTHTHARPDLCISEQVWGASSRDLVIISESWLSFQKQKVSFHAYGYKEKLENVNVITTVMHI